MLERKLKIYETLYSEQIGRARHYFTKISEINTQEFNYEKFFRCKLRIKETNYKKETNYNNAVLKISLTRENIEMDFLADYIILGEDNIRNFSEDMQVLEILDREEIPSLKGRTLEGIFDNNSKEFCALCISSHWKYNYNLSQNFSKLIKDKVQNQTDSFKNNKINNELGEEDYEFVEGLRKGGLVDENYILIEEPKKETKESSWHDTTDEETEEFGDRDI